MDIVQRLFEAGAQIDVKDADEQTPLRCHPSFSVIESQQQNQPEGKVLHLHRAVGKEYFLATRLLAKQFVNYGIEGTCTRAPVPL